MSSPFQSFTDTKQFLDLLIAGQTHFENGTISLALTEEHLKSKRFRNITFESCTSNMIIDDSSEFIDCNFSNCTFSKLSINGEAHPQPKHSLSVKNCKIDTLEFVHLQLGKLEIESGEYDTLEISNATIETLKIQQKKEYSENHLAIEGSTIEGGSIVSYGRITFRNSDFQNLSLTIESKGIYFDTAAFTGVLFENCKLESGSFYQCRFLSQLKPTRMLKCEINNSHFDYCEFSWKFNEGSFSGNSFYSCNFPHSVFTGPANMTKNTFAISDLSDARFLANVDLFGSILKGIGLLNTHFRKCNLTKVDLTKAVVNQGTVFIDCATADLIIQQKTILGLRDSGFQSFSKEARMGMIIKDDLTTLKLEFSGPYMWLHVFSVFAWLTPYLIYLGIQGLKSQVNFPSPLSKTIFCKLFHFVQHGQVRFPGSGLVFGLIFLFLLLYNCNRVILLLKVLNLETKERFRGIPVDIDLQKNGWLKYQWKFNNGAYKYAIAISIVSLLAFLFRTVPF